jgi:hypothetical protein
MGKSIGKNAPRGIRNNNFGNLRITKDKWQGLREEQTDPEFFQFKSPKWGYRALIRTLQNYRKLHNCRTISDFINRWAPPCENNTSGYINRVWSTSGKHFSLLIKEIATNLCTK